jgi:excisionase family DNA binding protein
MHAANILRLMENEMDSAKKDRGLSVAERMALDGAWSVDEVAQWAGVGRVKVWAEIKEKRLKVVRLGRRTLVRAPDAKAWLSSLSGEAT